MKKVLIAPWGNPFSWKEVSYSFNDRQLYSKTSLSILVNELKPDHIWILVGDSLAKDLNNKENYHNLKKDVEERMKNFLCDNFSEDILGKVRIFVLPGTGYFPNGVFRGQIIDYYYRLIYELSLNFSNVSFNEKLEVHLDLTHGLNFMPVLTYKAVKEILQVISLFKDIQFVAHNADPFSSNMSDMTLHIHEVENIKITHLFPALSPYKPEENDKFFEKLVIDVNDKKIKAVDKNWLKQVLTFLGGGVFGLPLVLTTFFVPSKEINSHLEEAIKEYEDKISIYQNTIKKEAKLTPLFRILSLIYLFSKFLENDLSFISKSDSKSEISLKDFKTLYDKIFKQNILFKNVIGKEIKSLESLENISDQWECWNKIENKKCDSIDPRNFFAHAGLEKNAVQLRISNSEKQLRYDPTKQKNIKNFVLKTLY
ncbi:CRISPR-associated CARF protein Csx1 [Thermodesulfatator autotrophicus]|uniref:CRISPR-associated protein n=1 Tax=Thermodesulfatator autotrophicus TaxID=1795632 RepID=A0A177E7D1_9BACT|nr:CRISPR-associated CARF protein Csx1 [Thermodesulfatator autotrophicus]OAG26929.1 hypothetical protein TH606_09695 [Thermodesulfatator autotrophicus]